MHRFYVADADFSAEIFHISDPAELHHIVHVLRLKIGDKIHLFNESEEEATAIIQKITPQRIALLRESIAVRSAKRTAILILACAIPKKSKFEWIIEKCTELGVDEIIPLQTARTEVRLAQEKAAQKLLRYQTVAKNAAKQSKRRRLPQIHPITSFNDALRKIDNLTAAYIPCLTGDRKKIFEVLKSTDKKKIIFFIGPEGDFTPQEIAAAMTAGCIPVSLGENVLKVDTAALSVMAFANLLLSESGPHN